jgi:hypothetical protein
MLQHGWSDLPEPGYRFQSSQYHTGLHASLLSSLIESLGLAHIMLSPEEQQSPPLQPQPPWSTRVTCEAAKADWGQEALRCSQQALPPYVKNGLQGSAKLCLESKSALCKRRRHPCSSCRRGSGSVYSHKGLVALRQTHHIIRKRVIYGYLSYHLSGRSCSNLDRHVCCYC